MDAAMRSPGMPTHATRTTRLALGRPALPLRLGPSTAKVGTPLIADVGAPLLVEVGTSTEATSVLHGVRGPATLGTALTVPSAAIVVPKALVPRTGAAFTFTLVEGARKAPLIVEVALHGMTEEEQQKVSRHRSDGPTNGPGAGDSGLHRRRK